MTFTAARQSFNLFCDIRLMDLKAQLRSTQPMRAVPILRPVTRRYVIADRSAYAGKSRQVRAERMQQFKEPLLWAAQEH